MCHSPKLCARSYGAKEILSLISEGYMIVSQSTCCDTIILRHRSNGNKVRVTCTNSSVTIFKNGKVCKHEVL